MNRQLPAAMLLLLFTTGTWATNAACRFEQVPVGMQKLGPWIDKEQLAGHRKPAHDFCKPAMSSCHRGLPQGRNKAKVAPNRGKSIPFPVPTRWMAVSVTLDSARCRLYADGLIVLRTGRLLPNAIATV